MAAGRISCSALSFLTGCRGPGGRGAELLPGRLIKGRLMHHIKA